MIAGPFGTVLIQREKDETDEALAKSPGNIAKTAICGAPNFFPFPFLPGAPLMGYKLNHILKDCA